MKSARAGSAMKAGSWEAWLQAIRPRTLVAGAAPIAVGTAVAASVHELRPLRALTALASVIVLQIGVNLANDVEDFQRGADTADRLGPTRVTQAGLLSAEAVKRAALGCFAVAFLLGCMLALVGGWPILALGLISIVCGYLYTGGPRPLAYLGLGDALAMGFFGCVAVVGTALLQAGRVPALGWIAWVPVGCLATAILVVNNLRDRFTDARAGKRTLAVRIGAGATRAEYVALLATAFAVPAVLFALRITGPFPLVSWAAAPLALRPLRTVLREDGAILNRALGDTARLELVFCLLFAAGLLP